MTELRTVTDHIKPTRPVRIAQFGGGVFLRGFFDWMLQKANDSGAYNGNATVIRAKTRGTDPLAEQNYLYTQVCRDGENSDITLIDSIEGSINPSDCPMEFFKLAVSPSLETVVSNTTEAGIVYQYCDFSEDTVPESFPARLTRMLYERYKAGLSGMLILPCELIENNGETLRGIVKKHSADWSLGSDFDIWTDRECSFRNTLVDRIVSGKPTENIPLPYTDNAVNTAEFFHLWVIDGAEDPRIPFASSGANIKWVNDVNEYRTLKVRILNGAHTSMIPYALLSGVETVGECMKTPLLRNHLTACLFDEIIPSLGKEKLTEATEYAGEVIKRFENPYICHRCEAISLNSVSKFKVRVLPSIIEYRERYGKSPKNLIFAFAQLIKFYKEGTPKDDSKVITFIRENNVRDILSNAELWDADLSYLTEELEEELSERS